MKKKSILFLTLALGLVGIGVFRSLCPDPLQSLGYSQEILADDGRLLRLTLSPDEKYRIYRPLSAINPDFVRAVLLSEDRFFYQHPGINPFALLRAFRSLGGNRKVGGSTITMQLVRLKHRLYTRSVLGKLRQMIYALGYEILYSKKDILQAYLNLTPYGGNIEGVEAASRIYFGKNAKSVNLLESLTLAVIPQNPLKRSMDQDDRTRLDQARAVLTAQWLRKYPESRPLIAELQLPVVANRISQLPFRAPHFVEQILVREPNRTRIQTTLSIELQEKLESVFETYLQGIRGTGVKNGGMLLVDARKREIKAWVGSGSYFDSEIKGQIDAVTLQRSPGSTLKPFVYGLAMDQGLIHPDTILKDTPASFGNFDPENFDRRYVGPISATQALVQSRNVPAIQISNLLKGKTLYSLLQDVGVQNLRSEKNYGVGLVLGTAEVTPEDLAGLYTGLYHQGEWEPLRWVREKENRQRKGLGRAAGDGTHSFAGNRYVIRHQGGHADSGRVRLLSRESAFLALDMLTQTQRDSSSLMDEQIKSRAPVAWKTGTSFGFRDAWTAGVFGQYVLVVWLGNFDFSENPHLIGREIAAPLFFRVVDLFPREVLLDHGDWTNAFGLNLKKVETCSISGHLKGEHCPHGTQTWFIPGISPIAACELHRQIAVSPKTGKRLCGVPKGSFQNQVFEFWPSDILDVFQKYGVRRKTPPGFEENCEFQSLRAEGFAPEITSPKRELKYVISFGKARVAEKIPLRAIVDGDVRESSWFINQEFIGTVGAQETLYYEAKPGRYQALLVDDHGRSVSRDFEVTLQR